MLNSHRAGWGAGGWEITEVQSSFAKLTLAGFLLQSGQGDQMSSLSQTKADLGSILAKIGINRPRQSPGLGPKRTQRCLTGVRSRESL